MKGINLSQITWEEAAEAYKKYSLVMLPIGAGTKEHGKHLPCGTDLLLADELARRVVENAPVIALPSLPYAYYPAFVDWPGSVSIQAKHFTDFVADIIKSFHHFGFQKFLILDTGVSTHMPLRVLSSDLYNELGIKVAVTNIVGLLSDVENEIAEQKTGGHGDEMETSMILAIEPGLVNMDKAVEEYTQGIPDNISKSGLLKISMGGKMITSTGINGNATLASAEKGNIALERIVKDIIRFIEYFEKSCVPEKD